MRAFKNQTGQMLVQVIVASAIAGIVMMSILSIMNNQTRAASAITQKLGANDLQQVMSTAINAGGACQAIINNLGSAATFASSLVGSPNPPIIPITRIPISGATGAPTLVTIGSQPSSMTNSLVIKNLQLVVKEGLASGAQFRGEIQAIFDETKLIIPLRPVSVGVILQTNGGGSPIISSCKPDPGAGGDLPGTPCKLPGEANPRGIIMYNWSGNVGPSKLCCMMDPTTQNISYGAFSNGGYGTFILACKPQ